MQSFVYQSQPSRVIFGAGTLVAISAPTSLAIERARHLGLTVAAVARRDGWILFTVPH